jgi:hypothetical protein
MTAVTAKYWAPPLYRLPWPVTPSSIDHLQRKTAHGLQHELPPALDARLVALGAKAQRGSLAYATVAHSLCSGFVTETKPLVTSSVSNNGIATSNMACRQMVCLRSKLRLVEARGNKICPELIVQFALSGSCCSSPESRHSCWARWCGCGPHQGMTSGRRRSSNPAWRRRPTASDGPLRRAYCRRRNGW